MDTMESQETTAQRQESTRATQESHTTSKTNIFLIIPREVRDMIYDLVLGDHTIHIKSDVISQKADSEDDEHDDEDDGSNDDEDDDHDDEDEDYGSNDDDDDDDGRDDDDDGSNDDDDDDGDDGYSDDDDDESDDEEDEELPAELSEILSDDRGPLYHRICKKELLHPKDAQLYRIRSLEANGSGDSRVQSDIVVRDFKHVNCHRLLDPNLEYETIGNLEEEEEAQDEPTGQVKLAFLRANKQVYQEATTILYSTRTFGFDDPTTFAQFFSINYNHVANPPTSTQGTSLLDTKRSSIRSVHIRARTALYLRQKVLWMAALDAATFVLPGLEKIRITFDLCHEGKERHVDRSLWQYWRHRNGFPLLKTAEVRVATDLLPIVMMEDDAEGEGSQEFRDVGWRVQLLEAIVGHHMDVLFGGSLLDPASVTERDATFARG